MWEQEAGQKAKELSKEEMVALRRSRDPNYSKAGGPAASGKRKKGLGFREQQGPGKRARAGEPGPAAGLQEDAAHTFTSSGTHVLSRPCLPSSFAGKEGLIS